MRLHKEIRLVKVSKNITRDFVVHLTLLSNVDTQHFSDLLKAWQIKAISVFVLATETMKKQIKFKQSTPFNSTKHVQGARF